MFDAAESLRSGMQSAGERLRDAQRSVARAGTGTGGRSGGLAMAQIAQASIFNEALLSATKARLVEIKAVTK